MSIASRITSIEEHIGNAYDSINKFGVDTSVINRNIENIANVINDDIYDKLPKITQSGAGFTLENVQNGQVDDFKMNGTDLEQDTTIGKNLCGIPNQTFNHNGVDVTIQDGEITLNGTCNSSTVKNIEPVVPIILNGNYTLNIIYIEGTLSGSNNFNIRKADNQEYINGISLEEQNKFKLVKFTSDTSVIYGLYATKGTVFSNFKMKIQLISGTEADYNFELYTGGSPSPSPDYPQDVRVVTGNNSVKVIGKNLFDTTITKAAGDGRIRDTTLETGKKLTWNGASATTGYMWLGYVIKDITNYVGKIVRFKTNFSASASNTPQYAIGICDSDGENRTSKASSSTSGNTISFTIPSLSGTQTYLYVLLYANSGGTLSPNDYVDFTNMILTIDNEDMTYIPYQSQTYPINLGTMELCKIGNYQDYIYKDNGKWYKHSEIGKVVLDGSEENLSYNSTDNRLQMPFNLQTQDWGVLALTLCDHFTMGDTEIVDGSFNITRTILFFKNNNLTSLNDWKTWLGSNNTTVYYILATPTNEEITDTTLINQLEAISVYTGTNIITISSDNDMIPEIEITRLKELERLS